MARPRSTRFTIVKERLIHRIAEGYHRPGERFISNRAVAAKYGVSYQTAHRLLAELCAEGHLDRRGASGTYLPGRTIQLEHVSFYFDPRARRSGSFGNLLHARMAALVQREGLRAISRWRATRFDAASYPVIWERPGLISVAAHASRYALLLNQEAPPGLAALFLDSISLDDYSGGCCAAQLFRDRGGAGRLAILGGPADDPRSRRRIEGFRSICPRATVHHAQSWYFEGARDAAARIAGGKFAGVFCCNDRLAEALLCQYQALGRSAPRVIGFDDAPIAEQLNLTTIAIPWDEMVEAAGELIRRRMAGDSSASRRVIISPRPIVRSFA